MSNFNCDKCGTAIIDSPIGYITSCEHKAEDVNISDIQVDDYTNHPGERCNSHEHEVMEALLMCRKGIV